MFKVSLKNQVRQTPLPRSQSLLPLFEAVMNAVQAINDRGGKDGRIDISVQHERSLIEDQEPCIESITIADNGIGMNDANFDSFNTAFSEHRFAEGGKGLGRLIWLRAFTRVEIESTFDDGVEGGLWRRSLVFDLGYDGENDIRQVKSGRLGTVVKLLGFLSPFKESAPRELALIAERTVEHFLPLFARGGLPQIVIADETSSVSLDEIYNLHFALEASRMPVPVGDEMFNLTGFRLRGPRADAHRLLFTAHGRVVKNERLSKYVPNLIDRLDDESGAFYYVGILEGGYLDERVNRERTSFDIEADEEELPTVQPDLYRADHTLPEMRSAAISAVKRDLAPYIEKLDQEKDRRVTRFIETEAPQYRMLLRDRQRIIERIPPTATNREIDRILHDEIRTQEIALKETSDRIIQEAAHIDDYEGYKNRLSDFVERHSDLGVSALAHYVMHRKVIIDLFEKALQKATPDDAYPIEAIAHNIIYPMRHTSENTLYSQHNLWMIDERLAFHGYVTSDRKLSKDAALESPSDRRPDIAIFDRRKVFAEGDQPLSSIVIVEFKRPGRGSYYEDHPVDQILNLVDDIRAGKFVGDDGRQIEVVNKDIPAYAYLVCDINQNLERALLRRDMTAMPDNLGYYGYNKHSGLYYEVLKYNKILIDARKRNRALFDKLAIN